MKTEMRAELLRMSCLLVAASFALPTVSLAQGTTGTGTGVSTPAVQNVINAAQTAGTTPSSTIIPTDTLPLPAVQNRMTFAENLQLRILQKLPARFYFNSTCEVSGRDETNPFQFPKKESLMRQLPPPPIWRQLNAFQQAQLYDIVGLVARNDMVFRVLPNVTGGWTLTPRTRVYGNYFMIRDQLSHMTRLNTVIHSVGMGLQQDIPITSRGNLQAEIQWRQLYQLHQRSVFDFLPGLTFSYVLTPRVVLFTNALFQLRGRQFFQAPTKEMDPFYTWGALYQKNGWTFSASTTLVQNFRHPFRKDATIPQNNYSFISDFEVSRRVIKQLPGLQAFVRAEPIWNFHSRNTPGLSGMDFRLFFGMRMSLAKPALTSALEQLRQQLEEQETEPTAPGEKKEPSKETKPSAYIAPHEIIASSPQPMHGYINEATGTEDPQAAPQLAPVANSETQAEPAPLPSVSLKEGAFGDGFKGELASRPAAMSSSAGQLGMGLPADDALPVSLH
ncbi:MAG: hypothetical protein K2X27_06555 [Candidatus Obscuribacterales bacterium]|nr:hypothetical protein [Candidatus Obscuribacterales bacterium]